jgi:non-canonical purine NTP pyrophosphatase, rdgB/HAM1 family
MKIVFATNNKHKLDEVRKMVGDNIEIVSLADIACYDDIPETAKTLEGNALLKAKYIKDKFNLDCFADDTGLEVEALDNAPGVYSARYAGETQDAEANMQKLLLNMKNEKNRNANFRTSIALILGEEVYTFEGIVKGYIAEEKRGINGFGYDPLFIPEGHSQTFAELGNEIKNTISHRAEAVRKLTAFLYSIS